MSISTAKWHHHLLSRYSKQLAAVLYVRSWNNLFITIAHSVGIYLLNTPAPWKMTSMLILGCRTAWLNVY